MATFSFNRIEYWLWISRRRVLQQYGRVMSQVLRLNWLWCRWCAVDLADENNCPHELEYDVFVVVFTRSVLMVFKPIFHSSGLDSCLVSLFLFFFVIRHDSVHKTSTFIFQWLYLMRLFFFLFSNTKDKYDWLLLHLSPWKVNRYYILMTIENMGWECSVLPVLF